MLDGWPGNLKSKKRALTVLKIFSYKANGFDICTLCSGMSDQLFEDKYSIS